VSGGPSVGDLVTGWSLDPAVVAGLTTAAVAYAAGVRRAGPWPPRRSVAFAGALAAIALALLSGLDGWAERLLSVHMVQHLLLTMVAPPLLVLAAPERLALRALPRSGTMQLATALRSRAARVLTRPVLAWCALPFAMLLVHLPGPFGYALTHPWAHHLEHMVLLGASILFWVPVLGGALAAHRLSALGRLAYLFAAMGPMGVVGAVLTSTETPIYPHYAGTARALGVSASGDQQLGGAVMWVGGGYVLVAATLVSVWTALLLEERRARAREAYEDAGLVA
jgi:cytochrome c oxidase assembly factor CtaG